MCETIYRCGWCGNITDEKGHVLGGSGREDAIKELKQNGDKNTKKVNGECCPNEDQ